MDFSKCKNLFQGTLLTNSQSSLKSGLLMSRSRNFASFPPVNSVFKLSGLVVTVAEVAVNHCFAHETHSVYKGQTKESRGKQKTEQRNSRKGPSQYNPTVPEWTS